MGGGREKGVNFDYSTLSLHSQQKRAAKEMILILCCYWKEVLSDVELLKKLFNFPFLSLARTTSFMILVHCLGNTTLKSAFSNIDIWPLFKKKSEKMHLTVF